MKIPFIASWRTLASLGIAQASLTLRCRCKRDKRKSWVKWQPAFRLVKVVCVVGNRQHRVHNQTVVPVVSVVVKTKAQKIIDKSERLVETRYCLTG